MPAHAPGSAAAAVRAATFVALGAFGALAWGALLSPGAPGRMLLAVALAVAAPPAVIAARGMRGWPARATLAGLVVTQLAGVLLVAGVPARLLAPGGWGELAAGIGQGIEALPTITVPYRGADEWVRTVVLAGGALLAVTAGWLAFRRRSRAGDGPPLAAAVLLGALYAVAVVQHGPQVPFLAGGAFALLLGAFLWGERLRPAQVRLAVALGLCATALSVVVAPVLDGRRPLLDYERIADELRPASAVTFAWTHGYRPLEWPRDGREVLRVRARTPAYWKAANLDRFDGVRWRTPDPGAHRWTDSTSEPVASRARWHQTIRVVVRHLRSSEYVGAGTTEAIIGSRRGVVPASPGTFLTGDHPLGAGDDYRARVYTPRPSAQQLRRPDPHAYPSLVYDDLLMDLPPEAGGPPATRAASGPWAQIQFTAWGDPSPPRTVYPDRFPTPDGARVLRASRYARAYALAQSLRSRSSSPYDFVRRVQRRLRQGAEYSEDPPTRPLPLDAFLFEDRLGYCQHFSGAMALLLRMGGVPARVAAGFAPGTYDRWRDEYVVRDVDAHSWVEAYFPRYGWVPFDPTPAIAPPRSQASDDDVSAATGDRRDTGGRADAGSDSAGAPTRSGRHGDRRIAALGAGAIVAAIALVGWGLALGRRRHRSPGVPVAPELAELVQALRRTGRSAEPPLTLARLERLLDGDHGAAAYVRALREHRYAGLGAGPTSAQRRALRRSLSAGLGPGGRVRAWLALPPRPLAWRWARSGAGSGPRTTWQAP
jgi:transglutaminase-like putative cysteine protease